MDAYQKGWMLILIPFFAIYGSYELYHGLRRLKNKKFHANPAIHMRVWLLRLIRGNATADEYYSNLEKDPASIALRATYSILFGIISLAACTMWVLVLLGIIS